MGAKGRAGPGDEGRARVPRGSAMILEGIKSIMKRNQMSVASNGIICV